MDLQGKTVVISGGSSGIGRATALLLAARGADVTVIGRDPVRGAEVAAALREASGGVGRFVRADLSLIADTRRVVADLDARLHQLDALILSAGALELVPATTSEGLDRTFVANFLHKLVLAEGLKPLLARVAGRMVLVAADVPDWVGPGWRNYEGARRYAGVLALPRLQAASLAMAQALAEQWRPDGIDVTAIHPGQVDTGIYRALVGWPWRLLKSIISVSFVPVDAPARLLATLAFDPEAGGLAGHLFPSVKRRLAKRRRLRRDDRTLDRVMTTARGVLAGV